MKKIIVVVSSIIIVFAAYNIAINQEEETPPVFYQFDFETIDRDFWLVGQWETYKEAYDLANMNEGVLTLNSENSVYLLSKPIPVIYGDVVTIKRRIKISHNDIYFAGGLAMYQTDAEDMIPNRTDGSWMTSLGDGVTLIEYSYDLSPSQNRPGKDVVRFLAADWEYNDNYKLINPIYDEWIDETLVYDTRVNQITYALNGTSYVLNSYKLDRTNIRFLMHAYGEGAGNQIQIDDVSILVENKATKRLNR
jgi:hypothetical protein